MSGELGRRLEDYVTSLVASGRYRSKSEVLREGVRLVQERKGQLAALDVAIVRGVQDSDAGRGKPAREVFDRLTAKYAAMVDRSG